MPGMQECLDRMQAMMQIGQAFTCCRATAEEGLRQRAYYDAGMPNTPRCSDKCNRMHKELASQVAGQTGDERLQWGA